jgi:hypothetical protein
LIQKPQSTNGGLNLEMASIKSFLLALLNAFLCCLHNLSIFVFAQGLVNLDFVILLGTFYDFIDAISKFNPVNLSQNC